MHLNEIRVNKIAIILINIDFVILNACQRSVYGVVASRRVLCTIHIVVLSCFIFFSFLFSFSMSTCGRTFLKFLFSRAGT